MVVSKNVRNRNLNTVLAARVTATPKAGVPTAVPLGAADPLVGSILVDDLIQLFDDETGASRPAGSLSPRQWSNRTKHSRSHSGPPSRNHRRAGALS